MSRCLKTLTETLEEGSFLSGDIQVRRFSCRTSIRTTSRFTADYSLNAQSAIQLKSNSVQKKLKKKLSHLVLVSDAPAAVNPEVGEPNTGHGSDEERPLLRNEEPQGCSTSSSQQDDSKVTSNHSLIPDSSLTAQVRRCTLDDFRLATSEHFEHRQGKTQSCTHSTPCWQWTDLYNSGCMPGTSLWEHDCRASQGSILHQMTCYNEKHFSNFSWHEI